MSQNQIRRNAEEQEIPLSMFENEEKVSYLEYQSDVRPVSIEIPESNNQDNEDCEWECDSEFMADMPTNESYSNSEGNENNDDQAIKFLTETGMLTKLDTRLHFDLNWRSDSSNLGDIDSLSRVSHEKLDEDPFLSTFKIFEDPFNEIEFNPAETLEKQLQKDPIPEPVWMDISVSDKMSEVCVEKNSDIDLYPQDLFVKDPDLQASLSKALSTDIRQTIDGTENNDNNPQTKETKKTKRKLTEFGYLLQRKGFRLMRKYYKGKFEEFAKSFKNYKKKSKISPQEITEIVAQYAHQEFGTILPLLQQNEFEDLIHSLKIIVLSDRSNKKEPMIEGLDFSTFKNLWAKYTQKNMKLFMQESSNSFIYTHFYLINGRLAWYEQEDVDQTNFNTQMKKLVVEACKYLSSSIKPVYEGLLKNSKSLV